MIASACLTPAGLHLSVWLRDRSARTSLRFGLTAVATILMAYCELWMMLSDTPSEIGRALWWIHLPAWAVVAMLVGLVRLHFRARRRWLGGPVCALLDAIHGAVGQRTAHTT